MCDDRLPGRLIAEVWWCGDDWCDCTEPQIIRLTPNEAIRFRFPEAVHRETVWQGKFISHTDEYTRKEREELQFAPLREACERFGVEVPEIAKAVD